MEVDEVAEGDTAMAKDAAIAPSKSKKQKVNGSAQANGAGGKLVAGDATTCDLGESHLESEAPMDLSADGEFLASEAQQLSLHTPVELTLTQTVEPYADGADTNELFASLRAHIGWLLETHTPLPEEVRRLILDMIGVADGEYLPLPAPLQQQLLQRVHTLRAPSACKVLRLKTPSAKWPPHPLVLEFGAVDGKPVSHLALQAQMTLGGAWMCLWNELLPPSHDSLGTASTSSSASSSSATPLARSLPSSSALTYSFRSDAAVGHRFKYVHATAHGLALVGDRIVLTLVFVEWRPHCHATGDEREVAWTCWKMRPIVDQRLTFKQEKYQPEQPEKD